MLMLEPVLRSLLLIMQLTEFMGANHLCFLVEDKDVDVCFHDLA